jgi:hypothetical protein
MITEFNSGPEKLPEYYMDISVALETAVYEELKAFPGDSDARHHRMAHVRVLNNRGEAIFDRSNPSDCKCLEEAQTYWGLFKGELNAQIAEDLKRFSDCGGDPEPYLLISRELAIAWWDEIYQFGRDTTEEQRAVACQHVLAKHGEGIFQKDNPADRLCLAYAKSYVVGLKPSSYRIIRTRPYHFEQE